MATTPLALSPAATVMRAGFQAPTVSRLRQSAERAQQVADSLQVQARDAWQEAVRAETNARGLDSRAQQAVAHAGQAQDRLVSFASRLGEAPAAPATMVAPTPGTIPASAAAPAAQPLSAWSSTPSPASVNNLGQPVGTFVNLTA
ncbi:MAG: hypothetical protein RBT42_14060 [Aquabacterium sp.]|jgi:hypothetical protein|uniref:hypothetical protein n=1 Tax=Aquabacterium sp. TaxID=1872578 RepID=UPI002A363164|nr:hypothetical protein [Aquabacterium sp.]MDX9844866.1 hypothetical protein [Aquabacterium sp.]